MVINKYSLGILFVILTMGSLFLNGNIVNDSTSSLNRGTYFDQWRPNTQALTAAGCDNCHADLTNSVGTGTLNMNSTITVYVYTDFLIQASVTGFTQASSDTIVIGFNNLDDNNSLFSVTSTGGTDYIASINVGSSGNSNSITFDLTAPSTPGTYTLKAYAVHASTSQQFYYLSSVVTVQVEKMNDTTPPVINSLAVNGQAYANDMKIRGNVTLGVDATDTNLAVVLFSTDGSTYTKMTYNSTSKLYDTTIVTSDYKSSTLDVTVIAIDKGLNNVTKSYAFTLDNGGLLPNSDIISFKVNKPVQIGDGKLDPIWDSVTETQISEFGSGGYIKTVQDGTYLYTLLAYDPTYTWIGIQFNVTSKNPQFMEDGSNGWIFGTGASNSFYGDYYFIGQSGAPVQNSGGQVFFDKISQGSMDYIETARLLQTTNAGGHDFEFNVSQTFTAVFASNVYHTSNHKVLTWTITDIAPPGAGSSQATTTISPPINLQQISDIVFVISIVIVIVTVFIHISLRVVSKPITHEKRIVYTNKIPNHPGSIPLIKTFLGDQKRKFFKPKPKTEKKV